MTRGRLALGALLCGALSAFSMSAAPAQQHAVAADERPNIVLISTDDQMAMDLAWMPLTRQWLAPGVRFPRGMSPHPLCCPARAALLTGQYGQNNGVHHNDGAYGGYDSLNDPDNTVARWLSDAGYQTGFVGKFLNVFDETSPIPLGWTSFYAATDGVSSYTATTFTRNGTLEFVTRHVDNAVTDEAVATLTSFAEQPDPMFVWVSYTAPHTTVNSEWPRRLAMPAPQDRGTLAHQELPSLRKPSFNEADVSDQLTPVRSQPQVDRVDAQERFVARIESLQAVDRGVDTLMRELQSLGELDNTYVFFVSDNGFQLGEHRLFEKNVLFTESLTVPFLVRVPGAVERERSQLPVTLTDVAPTIVELTGVTPGRVMDGVSFAPTLAGEVQPWRDTQLIQTGAAHGSLEEQWHTRGVWTERYTYARHLKSGREVLFDRLLDPYEITNVAGRRRYAATLVVLRLRLAVLESCAGPVCATTFGAVPGPIED